MSVVTTNGPFSWVRPPGQSGLMPGQEHVWAITPLPGDGVVFSVSAHPTRDYSHQALAVDRLSTAYGAAGSGPPAVNFVVRNVSDTPVGSYRMFVASINL